MVPLVAGRCRDRISECRVDSNYESIYYRNLYPALCPPPGHYRRDILFYSLLRLPTPAYNGRGSPHMYVFQCDSLGDMYGDQYVSDGFGNPYLHLEFTESGQRGDRPILDDLCHAVHPA